MKLSIRQVVGFGMGFLLACLVGEWYLRSADLVEVSRATIYEDIGKGFRTNFPYTYFSEGFAMGTINEARYLGPVYPLDKPAHHIRIALVGDSYVEGLQVFGRHHFSRILEQQLRDTTQDQGWEVLNMGRSNFDLGNMYAYHQLLVDAYQPDWILLFLSRDDLFPHTADPLLPLTTYQDSLKVSPTASTSDLQNYRRTQAILQHSRMASMLNSARRNLQARGAKAILLGVASTSKNEKPERYTDTLPPLPELSKHILAHLPASRTILIWREMSLPPQKLQAIATAQNLPLWHIAPPLQSLFDAGIHPFYWAGSRRYGHWNIDAHQAIGQWLSRKIHAHPNADVGKSP